MAEKQTYTCPSCGRLRPEQVLRDHKRPRCAFCNAGVAAEAAGARPDPRRRPPDDRRVMPS